MKVLLISVTAGFGHHSTANALADELTARGAQVQKVDLLEYVNKFIYKAVDKGYLFYTKHAPNQFGSLYRAMEKSSSVRSHFINDLVSELLAAKFNTYFDDFMPDVIITTHIFGAQVLDELKRRNEVACPVIGIVTDFTLHPFWNEVDRIEYIVTASELLNHRIAQRGIDQRRLLPFGIPIRPRFLKSVPKSQARQALGLREDENTILIMSGSMGHGNMLKVVAQLDLLQDPLQLLIVCGNNTRMRKKIEAIPLHHTKHVYGFVDNVDLMMDASDCIISKPGGLTTSETLAKRLPMVMVNPIPGQEEDNANFLVNTGMALATNKHFSVDEAVYYLFSNPRRLELIRQNIALFSHPDATQRLCDFIFDRYGSC